MKITQLVFAWFLVFPALLSAQNTAPDPAAGPALSAGAAAVPDQALDDAAAKTEINALSGKDASRRIEAAHKLGASKRADARKALVKQLKREKIPAIKRAVIEAMAGDSAAAGDAAVIAAAKTGADREVRASAAWTLGFSKDPSAYKALIAIMLDAKEAEPLRVRAASSLSNFQNAEVFNAYVTAFSDASAEVRKTAAMMAASVFSGEKEKLRPHFVKLSSDTDLKTAAYAAAALAEWDKKEQGLK
ncbi:MAG: hypothetical protein NTX59_01585 [Elusimicrobia bacterium]|nr:hypothetical protein [Elusimicrobiota bacterium]